MIIESIIAALVPVGVEGIKQVINKFTGGVKPTTVAEQIQLNEADIKSLTAIAALDNPYGTPSQWVVDLRASSRYISALAVIIGGVSTFYIPNLDESIYLIAGEMIGVVFGFLFGTRIVANFKK